MTDERYISLVALNAVSKPILIRGGVRLAIGITHSSSFTWGAAVVTLQWTADPDLERWHAFNGSKTLTTTRNAYDAVAVAGVLAVRLKVTTADGGADPLAPYDWAVMLPGGVIRTS